MRILLTISQLMQAALVTGLQTAQYASVACLPLASSHARTAIPTARF